MLHSKANWNFLQKSVVPKQVDNSSEALSPVTLELLEQRGMSDEASINAFLSPDLSNLYDASRIHMIDTAADRVHQAIASGEKILVFGDYDADGVSSTTVMLETLYELGAKADFYIPNRFTEGYGPNEAAFRQAMDDGFSLIITVDTGIAAHHEVEVANEIGLDVIITDHHEVQVCEPDAFSVIHPKCSSDYPFKELAGVGVAFKFAAYLLGYFPRQFLDVLAIGTISDMVPLLDENRILAHFGLESLSKTIRPGLSALIDKCQIDTPLTAEDIGFKIGPRLNAVGRLQDATLAVQLLMTDDENDANMYSEKIDTLNKERKQIVEQITAEAEEMVSFQDESGVIVVAKEGWNEGVLGIAASRLVQAYDRPAIVLSIDTDANIAKGSARSIPAFDLFRACMEARDIFTHFGGHAQAAGMSLPEQSIDELRGRLDKIIWNELNSDDFKPSIDVNGTLTLPEIDEQLIQEIGQLAPFGMDNPKPVFQIEAVPGEIRQIGNQKNHLKMEFKQDTYALSAIGFRMGHLFQHIAPKTQVSIIGELGVNEWNGRRKLQIVMEDLAVNTWQLFDLRGKKKPDFQTLFADSGDILALGTINEATKDPQLEHIPVRTYENGTSELEVVSTMLLLDLPNSLEQLQAIVEKVNPTNIHACYTVTNGVYMQPFPSREDFIWFYALIKKRSELDLRKELQDIMRLKNWKKDRIIFMAKVFQELEFVKINKGVLYIESRPIKKDLQDSMIYQQRKRRASIEKTLYYSTYDTLKDWFKNCLENNAMPKEELAFNEL